MCYLHCCLRSVANVVVPLFYIYIIKATTLTIQKCNSSAVNGRQAATVNHITTGRGLGPSLSRLLRNNTFEPDPCRALRGRCVGLSIDYMRRFIRMDVFNLW